MSPSIFSLPSASLLLSLFTGLTFATFSQENPKSLWQIGQPDRNDAEFALGPGGVADFQTDAFFVVGQSEAKRDWPYVQPGPGDAWAGSRQHTFTVLFNLKTKPAPGDCRFQVGLVDTHYSNPPKVRIQINGHDFEQSLAKGNSDESIHGQPLKGRPSQFDIRFNSELLQAGDNDLQMTTLSGSWMLYDWLGLEITGSAELGTVSIRTVVTKVQSMRAISDRQGKPMQPVRVTLKHFGEGGKATVRVPGAEPVMCDIKAGEQTSEVWVPAVSNATECAVTVDVNGQRLASHVVTVLPVRKLTVYVLPHSHTDIGYTEIQTAIEKKQVNNLLEGIAAARRTANYPEGARFVWNVEVLWAADLYLHRMSESQRGEFLDAVKKGWVGLNGMYLNELTGLCRPEELMQLFRYATQLAEQTGVPIDSAMISDVPGYTWGTVTAMSQAGIRYFSTAPNYFDRIGDILVQWENKPFWWTSPSGRERVLVWIPYMGYAMSHLIHRFSPEFINDYQSILEKEQYPYDIAYVRWSGHGDNAIPDPEICEFFKDWNTKYTWPKFVIARTSDAFRAFEDRFGNRLPVVRGDWTPYWEDGAGSSALETAMNRNTSDRLVQADALFALAGPVKYPAGDFQKAWRNTLLYSEHTWGADCSVSDPESKKTKEQWEIKKSYAVDADRESRQLLARGLELFTLETSTHLNAPSGQFDVLNTTSWPRTELVQLPKEVSSMGDRLTDDHGLPVPSQRLSSGELAFIAKNVAPFSTRRFSISAGKSFRPKRPVEIQKDGLDNGLVRFRLNPVTGGISEFSEPNRRANLVDTTHNETLNDFLFLPGEDIQNLQRNGPVTIRMKEAGPLVGTLIVESSAPACNKLSRELRIVADLDYVELLDTVDKQRAAIPPKGGDGAFAQKGGKESIHFAFPFNIPGGEAALDIPLGVMWPEKDQMPSACKNWFTVGRWVDVANADFGVTLVTLDAPLLELGGITANLTGSQTNPKAWRKHVDPTQRIYVWAMNNHWHTNYRAYQEGPVTFRFILRPHRKFDPAEATRFATGFSQPLLPIPAPGPRPSIPTIRIEPSDVLVSCLKPSDDGKGWIVRLFGAGGADRSAKLTWSNPTRRPLHLSDASEKAGQPISSTISVPAWDVVTLRVE